MDSRAFCPAGGWAESSAGWLGTGRRSPAAGATSAPGLSWTPAQGAHGELELLAERKEDGGGGMETASKGLALPLGKAGVVWFSSWASHRLRCRRRRLMLRQGRGAAALGSMAMGRWKTMATAISSPSPAAFKAALAIPRAEHHPRLALHRTTGPIPPGPGCHRAHPRVTVPTVPGGGWKRSQGRQGQPRVTPAMGSFNRAAGGKGGWPVLGQGCWRPPPWRCSPPRLPDAPDCRSDVGNRLPSSLACD